VVSKSSLVVAEEGKMLLDRFSEAEPDCLSALIAHKYNALVLTLRACS